MHDILVTAAKYHRDGRFGDAEQLYLEYLGKHPASGKVLMALAHACYMQGRRREAIDHLARARQITPSDPDIHYELGNMHAESNDIGQAYSCFREAIRLKPDHGGAWLNLGYACYHARNYTGAIEAFSTAVKLDRYDAKAAHNLGLALMRAGRAAEADPMLRRACELAPDNAAIHTCVLFNLHNLLGLTSQEIYMEHLQWARRFGVAVPDGPGRSIPAGAFGQSPIRVGYLSPDFRRHSVFYFIHPVLKAHDRAAVTSYCYSDVEQPDEATRQLMDAADHWRDISRMHDEQVFNLVRQDGIDLLVDLAGHTYRNRLRMLSRKPAPVQASWLGYPGTTGLRTIDHRLTDVWADPDGSSDYFHTEKLARLDRGFLCYEPPANAPETVEPPSIRDGHVTFGSFNNLAKINDQVLHAWSDILQRVPGSTMIMKAPGLDDESGRNTVLSEFRRHGIGEDRIECLGHMDDLAQHLAVYQRIDVALDTFPYNGTTTTCEALWMGVPVLTFAGERHASRVGTSILTNAGLAECIAPGRDAYVDLAVRLAGDRASLTGLRAGLRERVRTSPLMDARGFCRALENEYRKWLAANAPA